MKTNSGNLMVCPMCGALKLEENQGLYSCTLCPHTFYEDDPDPHLPESIPCSRCQDTGNFLEVDDCLLCGGTGLMLK